MRIHKLNGAVAAIAFGMAVALFQGTAHARPSPVGTAFTYQGQLNQGGEPLTDTADLQFSLWDGSDGSAVQVGATQYINAVNVVDGVFTVDIDFGSGLFGADARWLQIAVRWPAGSGAYITLSPRQRVRPAPVAHHAMNVNGATITNLNASNIATGTIGSALLSGPYGNALTLNNAANVFTGNGGGLASLNAGALATGTLPNPRLSGLYSSLLSFTNSANLFAGNGAGLTNLSANNINGNLHVTRMPLGGLWTLTSDLAITGANVGVGVNPPISSRLHVFGPESDGTNTSLRVTSSGHTLMMDGDEIDGTSAVSLNSNTPSNVNLAVGGGNVSIGTNSPQSLFDVFNTSTTRYTATFRADPTGPNWSVVHWGPTGDWYIRSAANAGKVILQDSGGNVGIGTTDPAYKLDVVGTFAANTVTIKGGSDLVEGFDSSAGRLDPGTVMVIDPDHAGQLIPSTHGYDSKVAGVVSGAGGVNPGLKMGQDGVMDGENLIALTGRVYVKCSTANGNIRPGDRLTTSALAGHAMKATDSEQADGAVIGKAMSSLESGEGLVLVLVNLQ